MVDLEYFHKDVRRIALRKKKRRFLVKLMFFIYKLSWAIPKKIHLEMTKTSAYPKTQRSWVTREEI